MWSALPRRFALLTALIASAALAADREQNDVRILLLSEHPDNATHRVYVVGQVITSLRFEKPVDPSKTRLLGWEGRFEPLGVVGRKVILEPIRDLASDEGVPLLVTLADGTEVPFLLRPAGEGQRPDQQVNVFRDSESYGAMASVLDRMKKEVGLLREENERLRKEETSEDHALASLLVAGAVAQTPFTAEETVSSKDPDAEIVAVLFRGKGKAAVVFNVKNLHAERPWSVRRVHLTVPSTGRVRTAVFRSTAPEFTPGTSGVVAIVTDGSEFTEEGRLTNLFLEVYRHDGLRTAFMTLEHQLIGQ
ncbi:DUF2381 family protein [Pyxidicoccus fallax]|uniref:DUF2381 family protein n=2 Tax=Pyxidicoccus fallax TaxID=394095 RepID=A0A848LQ90_9BACT|nr:DUF2381 family protein [Pyxidicoccus fallax]NMO20057.1 DUF2381 family protein [Pyxidicoccus fallax]NPC81692.1 DUF2381 family protein [Pyxidicoccus fallax]